MNKKILLQDLSDRMAKRRGVAKKDTDLFVRSVFEIIREYLQTDKIVKIKGLGTFKLVTVESRGSVDVNTGERIVINGYTKVSFTPDAALREEINKPFAQFETVVLNEGTDIAEMERIGIPESPEAPAEEAAETETAEPAAEPDADYIVTEAADDDSVSESLWPDVPATDDDQTGLPLTEAVEAEELEVAPQSAPVEEDDQTEIPAEPEDEDIINPDVTQESVHTNKPMDERTEYQLVAGLADNEPEKETVQQVNKMHVKYLTVEHLTVKNMHSPQSASKHADGQNTASGWVKAGWCLLVVLLMCLSYYAGHKHLLFAGCLTAEQPDVKTEKNDSSKIYAPENTTGTKDVTAQHTQLPAEGVAAQTGDSVAVKSPNPYPQLSRGEYEIVGIREVHRMKSGETLRTLATRYYGTVDYAEYIILFNDIKDPDVVSVGTELKIPELRLKAR